MVACVLAGIFVARCNPNYSLGSGCGAPPVPCKCGVYDHWELKTPIVWTFHQHG